MKHSGVYIGRRYYNVVPLAMRWKIDLLDANEAGKTQSALAREIGISRTRVGQAIRQARVFLFENGRRGAH